MAVSWEMEALGSTSCPKKWLIFFQTPKQLQMKNTLPQNAAVGEVRVSGSQKEINFLVLWIFVSYSRSRKKPPWHISMTISLPAKLLEKLPKTLGHLSAIKTESLHLHCFQNALPPWKSFVSFFYEFSSIWIKIAFSLAARLRNKLPTQLQS